MPRVRLRRKLHVREVTRELQPSRTRSLGNERQLPLDADIPLSTVDRHILHRPPKLSQQLPKVGIGKFVAVVEACDLQSSVNGCSALDGSVPRSKGLAQGITTLVPQEQRPTHVRTVVYHKHAIPCPTRGCQERSGKVDKNTFHRPLSLEGGLLRNGTPDSFRLTATVAVPPKTSYLNAPLLGGLSCIVVIGLAKREV